MNTQQRNKQTVKITRKKEEETPDRVIMSHTGLTTPEEENQTLITTLMTTTKVKIKPMSMTQDSLMNLMRDPILLGPQGQVEVQDQ